MGKAEGLGASNELREGKQSHGDWLWQVKFLLWEVVHAQRWVTEDLLWYWWVERISIHLE